MATLLRAVRKSSLASRAAAAAASRAAVMASSSARAAGVPAAANLGLGVLCPLDLESCPAPGGDVSTTTKPPEPFDPSFAEYLRLPGNTDSTPRDMVMRWIRSGRAGRLKFSLFSNRSICKPPQRLIFTKCMDQDKVTDNLRPAVTKQLIEYNPTVDDIHKARVVRNSSHRDGAIYNNKRLQEDFFEGDLADRNETQLEPMMFSKPTDVFTFPQCMFQFFSVLLSKSPISNGSVQLYGYIAARDERDGMLNYIVNYSRDNPIVVQQGSLIQMTGPKRGIQMCSIVLIEFDMRIKTGIQEDNDLQLIDGALACSSCVYKPWKPIRERIIGSSGAVDVTLAVLSHAVEATIEVVVSDVQNGLGLSLSSFLDIMNANEEVQLFDGIIAQSGPLRRFVVAVPISTVMLLKVKVGNVVRHTQYGSTNRQIKFQPKLNGCTRRQIRLKVATISLKVTWSAV